MTDFGIDFADPMLFKSDPDATPAASWSNTETSPLTAEAYARYLRQAMEDWDKPRPIQPETISSAEYQWRLDNDLVDPKEAARMGFYRTGTKGHARLPYTPLPKASVIGPRNRAERRRARHKR